MPARPGALERLRRLRTVSLAAVALVALALACTDEPEPDGPPEPATEDDAEGRPDIPSLLDDERGSPPSDLEVVDLVVGDGDEAEPGTYITVHYVGARWEDGTEFDASWDVDEPYVFELGAGRVIEGWEQGLAGGGDVTAMRVGGRRLLTIPPDLAYGDRGAGQLIGPDETLVFVVDLLDVEPVEEPS